jgi:hypothetical protein
MDDVVQFESRATSLAVSTVSTSVTPATSFDSIQSWANQRLLLTTRIGAAVASLIVEAVISRTRSRNADDELLTIASFHFWCRDIPTKRARNSRRAL